MVNDDRGNTPAPAPDLAPSYRASGVEHAELAEYPELELVMSLAVSAVIDAFHWPDEVHSENVFMLERAAIDVMLDVYTPIAATARCKAAEATRKAPAAVNTHIVETLAIRTAEPASALQERNHMSGREAATHAPNTADQVASTTQPGPEHEAAQVAARVTEQVHGTATATATETSLVADLMKHSVSLAVSQAAAADAAALAVELDTLNAALTVEAVAIDTCYRLALNAATDAAHATNMQTPAPWRSR